MKTTLLDADFGKMLAGISALDAGLLSGGLYAADPNLVFTKVVFPLLKSCDCRIDFSSGVKYAYFSPRTGGDQAAVTLESVSKIKVRQFGSHHVIDRHVRHESRWDEKKVERLVSTLWSLSPDERTGFVMLIGFDSSERVLGKELRTLEASLGWSEHGVTCYSKTWLDPHGRSFHTGAWIWAKSKPANKSVEPTPTVVTPAADAPGAPSAGVSHH